MKSDTVETEQGWYHGVLETPMYPRRACAVLATLSSMAHSEDPMVCGSLCLFSASGPWVMLTCGFPVLQTQASSPSVLDSSAWVLSWSSLLVCV